jgi:hypothetical protein
MTLFGEWEYSSDRDATILAYGQAEGGGVDSCDCNGCRNFRVARERVFPATFHTLLGQLGIDLHKDGEVWRAGRLALGRHVYGGWYHFIGTLDKTGDFAPIDLGPNFKVWMCHANAPRLPSLKEKSVVQVGFYTEMVPWLLDEPEPD